MHDRFQGIAKGGSFPVFSRRLTAAVLTAACYLVSTVGGGSMVYGFSRCREDEETLLQRELVPRLRYPACNALSAWSASIRHNG